MSEKHIGEVVQVIGPVLDIRFAHDELPPLLNAIEIDNDGAKLVAEVAQQVGDDFGAREIAIKPLYFARSRFAGILCLVSDPLTI